MRTMIHVLAATAAALLMAACGGSDVPYCGPAGCSSSGPDAQNGSISLALQDSTGTPLASPLLTGTQNALAVATVLNADAQPVPNALVTFAAVGLALTPASGQTLTDSNGVARVEIRSQDPFAQGATTLTASSQVDAIAVEASLAIGLGASTASVSGLTVSSTTVPAYQTIQVTVAATLDSGAAPAVQYPVNFSATCGEFNPAKATTDSSGIARTAYRNQVGSASACSGPQTLTATAGSSSLNVQVTAQQPVATNIVFVSATPSRIYLTGSPGAPGSQSLVKFKLVDNNTNPIQGQNIRLSLTLRPAGTYLGSTAGTTSLTQPTLADGTVSVSLQAGAEPGPVQIQAVLVADPTIANVSNELAVASGLPAQNAFSLSVDTFNMEALTTDGVTTSITLRIADRLGNPVPDGTTVNFVSEGGQVVASCNTSGAESNGTAACSVVLSSQAPRPSDGRVTVVAWAQGEESFTDQGTPSNNVWDLGEPYDALGQPFLDRNENGVYDSGVDSTVGTASGGAACPPLALLSVPNTCDSTWGPALVRAGTVIAFSGSTAELSGYDLSSTGAATCAATFTLKDENGNPMPSRSTLTIDSVKGGGSGTSPDAKFEGFGLDGDSTPNQPRLANEGSTHSAIFSNCSAPATIHFKLKVTTPAGKATTFLF